MLHKLALNALGAAACRSTPTTARASWPIWSTIRASDLVVALPARLPAVHAALAEARHRPPVATPDEMAALPAPAQPAQPGAPVAEHARQHPLHLWHHGPAQGLRALAPLRARSRRLVCRPGRPGGAARGAGAALQPAAAVPCERLHPVVLRDAAHGRLPGADRPLRALALVAGGVREPRHRRALPRRRRAHAAGPAGQSARARAPRALRLSARASSRSCTRCSKSASAFRWSSSGA